MLNRLILWSLCLVLVLAPLVAADSGPGDRIAFLQFHMAGNQITFTGLQVVPGKLKAPRLRLPAVGHLQVQLLDAAGREVASTIVPHPTHERYEYVDTDGQLKSVSVTLDSADFYVRVPYQSEITSARFEQIERVEVSQGQTKADTRTLGTVGISMEADRE